MCVLVAPRRQSSTDERTHHPLQIWLFVFLRPPHLRVCMIPGSTHFLQPLCRSQMRCGEIGPRVRDGGMTRSFMCEFCAKPMPDGGGLYTSPIHLVVSPSSRDPSGQCHCSLFLSSLAMVFAFCQPPALVLPQVDNFSGRKVKDQHSDTLTAGAQNAIHNTTPTAGTFRGRGKAEEMPP